MLPSHLSSGGLRLAHSGQQRTVGDALHALDASLEVGEVFADGHGCAWRRPGEGPHAQPQAGRMRVSKDKNTRCSPGPARLFRAYSHAEIDVLLVVVDGRPRVRGGSQRRLPRSKSAWADARRACEQRRVHSCSGGCNVHVCLATDDAVLQLQWYLVEPVAGSCRSPVLGANGARTAPVGIAADTVNWVCQLANPGALSRHVVILARGPIGRISRAIPLEIPAAGSWQCHCITPSSAASCKGERTRSDPLLTMKIRDDMI